MREASIINNLNCPMQAYVRVLEENNVEKTTTVNDAH